ncbi:MATE family efflux transporter, partial [Methylophaga sp. UBA1464]
MSNHTVTHRQVWHIAGPMIIANISTPLLGMVDTAMVGHLSAAHYLGAVAIGSMIFTFVFWGFGFLRMATTGLTSQAYGENNTPKMQAVLMQAIWLALIIALLLLLIQLPIRHLALQLVSSSAEVEHFAAVYFDIRIWSAPATLINYAI